MEGREGREGSVKVTKPSSRTLNLNLKPSTLLKL